MCVCVYSLLFIVIYGGGPPWSKGRDTRRREEGNNSVESEWKAKERGFSLWFFVVLFHPLRCARNERRMCRTGPSSATAPATWPGTVTDRQTASDGHDVTDDPGAALIQGLVG